MITISSSLIILIVVIIIIISSLAWYDCAFCKQYICKATPAPILTPTPVVENLIPGFGRRFTAKDAKKQFNQRGGNT